MESSSLADLAGSRSGSCAAVAEGIAGDAGVGCEVEELLGSAGSLAVRSGSEPPVGWTGCAFVGVCRHGAFSAFSVTGFASSGREILEVEVGTAGYAGLASRFCQKEVAGQAREALCIGTSRAGIAGRVAGVADVYDGVGVRLAGRLAFF